MASPEGLGFVELVRYILQARQDVCKPVHRVIWNGATGTVAQMNA
jgi:hypothetical protein